MQNTRRHHPSPADERGQTLAEYSVLVGLIAIVVAAAVPPLGAALSGIFQHLASAFGG